MLVTTGRGSAHAGCSPRNHLGSLAPRRRQLSRIHACQHYDHRGARSLAWNALETTSAVAMTPVLRHDRERRRCWLARGQPSDIEWITSGRRTTAAPRAAPGRSPDVVRRAHISLSPARMALGRVGLTSSARIPFVRRAHTRRPRHRRTTGAATRAQPPPAVSNPATPSVRTLVRSEGREPGRPWTSASARAGERRGQCLAMSPWNPLVSLAPRGCQR